MSIEWMSGKGVLRGCVSGEDVSRGCAERV